MANAFSVFVLINPVPQGCRRRQPWAAISERLRRICKRVSVAARLRCVSVVHFFLGRTTTESERTQSLHREIGLFVQSKSKKQ